MITIGADPEIFVINKDKEVVPVIGLLGGTKEDNKLIGDIGVLEDNVLAEFTIPYACSRDKFIEHINKGLDCIDKELPTGYSYIIKPSHRFTKEVLCSAGKEAMSFGCSPDFNALTGRPNPTPSAYTRLRTAGGHVHIGWDYADDEERISVVKMCDYLLGLSSILYDSDTERRELYGKAGAFRFKKYGIEYRTLSNYWLKTDSLIGDVYDKTILCVKYVSLLPTFESICSYEKLQRIINNSNKEEAIQVISKIEEELNELL